MTSKELGLIRKYEVRRVDGGQDCIDLNTRYSSEPSVWRCPEYFILKLWPLHIGHAQTKQMELDALKAYILSARKHGYEKLASDLEEKYISESDRGDLLSIYYPQKCPMTGLPFFMLIELDGEMMPTYGGPYDSYTIPERDDNGEYYRKRFDHDQGGWVEDEGMDNPVDILKYDNNELKKLIIEMSKLIPCGCDYDETCDYHGMIDDNSTLRDIIEEANCESEKNK